MNLYAKAIYHQPAADSGLPCTAYVQGTAVDGVPEQPVTRNRRPTVTPNAPVPGKCDLLGISASTMPMESTWHMPP